MDSYWNLIEEGKFQEAFDKLVQAYEETKRRAYLGNAITAAFLLRDYETVMKYSLISFETCEDNLRGDSELIYAGIALWLMNRYSEAVEFWKRGLEKNINIHLASSMFQY